MAPGPAGRILSLASQTDRMLLAFVYGYFIFIAFTNAVLMRRAPRTGEGVESAFAIPARNERDNLARLVPELRRQGARVYVFDDESSDGSADVAADAGAFVIRSPEPLPPGWTGKNRACVQLAKVVAEDFPGEWITFLDADMHPAPDFVDRWGRLLRTSRSPVVTGFPRVLPGRGLEPAYIGWVAWILGATNPFGLVARTGWGHNMFTNGQIVGWKTATYFDVQPNETLRDQLLEDVMIGRLLASRGIRVEVANLSDVIAVAMYRTLREAVDGMSKNSCFIWPGTLGSLAFAGMLIAFAWGWTLGAGWWPWLLGALYLSKILVDLLGRQPLWTVPLMPLTLTAGALTVVRSVLWRRRGRLAWKGRTYEGF